MINARISKSNYITDALKECLATVNALVDHLDSGYRNQNSKLEEQGALELHIACLQMTKHIQSIEEVLKGIESLFAKLTIP